MKDTEHNQRKSKTRAKESTDLVQKECTEGEKATIDNWVERSKNKPLRFKKVDRSSDKITLDVDEPDTLLAVAKLTEYFGTADGELQNYFLKLWKPGQELLLGCRWPVVCFQEPIMLLLNSQKMTIEITIVTDKLSM